METLEQRVDYFKRKVQEMETFADMDKHEPWFARLHAEAVEEDWTVEQIDDFGYEWMAKGLIITDMMMEKRLEERKMKREAEEKVVDTRSQAEINKEAFKKMCGL